MTDGMWPAGTGRQWITATAAATTLPAPGDLIAEVRQNDGDASVLDKYAPAIDELADTAQIAAWLGIKPATIHRERNRVRISHDWKVWPEPDRIAGRSPMWTYRTIVTHRAAAPGRGNYPRKSKPKGND